jgi:hypothetical protein
MYLAGGEFLLTTGLWRKRRADSERFVEVLRNVGVAAIGYGLPAPGIQVPSDVLAACQRHGMCLVEVPYETPFIAISKAFVELLTASRQERLVKSLKRAEAMTRVARDESGASGILAILLRDTGVESAVVTHSGEVFARSSNRVPMERVEIFLSQLRDGQEWPVEAGNDEQPIVFEIAATHSRDGYLLCFAESSISHEARAVFDQAVAHIGVALARQRAIRATELRFAGELLDLIAAGPARYRDLTDRLRGFGVDPAKPLAIISISATHDGSSEPEVGALDATIRELAVPGVVLARGTEHMLVLEPAREDLVLRAAETALHRLRINPGVMGGAVGIGSLARHTSALRRTLAEARQAHTIALHRQESYSLALPEHAGSHALLLAMADEEVSLALVRSLIDPLREHDARRQSELLRTLSTFLDHAGQWQQTAEDLHIHVNTLRHRIARIETLTGRNMSDMATRVDFYLALRVRFSR